MAANIANILNALLNIAYLCNARIKAAHWHGRCGFGGKAETRQCNTGDENHFHFTIHVVLQQF